MCVWLSLRHCYAGGSELDVSVGGGDGRACVSSKRPEEAASGDGVGALGRHGTLTRGALGCVCRGSTGGSPGAAQSAEARRPGVQRQGGLETLLPNHLGAEFRAALPLDSGAAPGDLGRAQHSRSPRIAPKRYPHALLNFIGRTDRASEKEARCAKTGSPKRFDRFGTRRTRIWTSVHATGAFGCGAAGFGSSGRLALQTSGLSSPSTS